MGDESDYWETMTPTQGVYVEFYAADQTPQPTDGDGKTRVCPNDQLIYKNAQLRMQHPITGENIDLEFRGPFTFIRHVSTTSPYPTALYEFNKHAYSYDKKYFAPAGNNVLLACDGNYIIRNSYMRFWSGYFYGKLYNGPIEENPNYKCDEENTYFYTTYDPYSSSGGEQKCSSGSSDGTSPNGSSWNCHWEWVIIEVNDGGGWTTYWEGWATICG
ncbi:MAG TPA: hypothetical protein VHG28_05490 [Longimicrobiaceae bacterium]|nr:hypothetical protein [Longimicrobiaceae bacterium]